MRIETAQTIAGQPALRIRDFFRRERDRGWPTSLLREALALSARTAGRVVTRLEAGGYIVRDRLHRGKPYWRVAPLGRRLAHAKGARPIARRTAERLLGQFLKRVESAAGEHAFKRGEADFRTGAATDVVWRGAGVRLIHDRRPC
jgi:DNA-binding MarR family transcriptional regulator